MADVIVAQLTQVFVTKLSAMLSKVVPRLKDNWLTITVRSDEVEMDKMKKLYAQVMDLEKKAVKVTFTIPKINQRDPVTGRYTLVDEQRKVEQLITLDNFVHNRKIEWGNGKNSAILNQFQISIFEGAVELTDLNLEVIDLSQDE